jgi:hypothetical protein
MILDAIATDDTEAAGDGRDNLAAWIERGGFLPAELSAMADSVFVGLRLAVADATETGGEFDFRIYIRPDGSADLATGAPDYDLDHRGFCGAGSVADGDTLDDCRKAVAAAFDDAIETYFCQ